MNIKFCTVINEYAQNNAQPTWKFVPFHICQKGWRIKSYRAVLLLLVKQQQTSLLGRDLIQLITVGQNSLSEVGYEMTHTFVDPNLILEPNIVPPSWHPNGLELSAQTTGKKPVFVNKLGKFYLFNLSKPLKYSLVSGRSRHIRLPGSSQDFVTQTSGITN